MGNLRRTLSVRRSKRSYKALPSDGKPSAIAEEGGNTQAVRFTKSTSESRLPSNKRTSSTKCTSTPVAAASAANTKGKQKGAKLPAFPSMESMKSMLNNVKQKMKGGQIRSVRLGGPMSVTNASYFTPRRSERIKSKSSPSPISLKMYSPFCIETPGAEDSFIRISKRKALSDLNESPLVKTPRRMVKAAVDEHKKLGKSISASQVVTSSGY